MLIIAELPEKGLHAIFGEFPKAFDDNIKAGLENLAPILADKIRETFDMKGARGDHAEWDIIHNPTPLIDTGNLYRSIEGEVQEKGDDYVIVVGTNHPAARSMNFGDVVNTDVRPEKNPGPGPRGKSMWIHTGSYRDMDIPEREFMFFLEDDADLADDALDTALDILKEEMNLE